MTAPPLWTHQTDGVAWATERQSSYLHLTMGAGKSRIAVTIADETHARAVLVVAPKTVVGAVWPAQFEQWSAGEWDVYPTTTMKGSVKRKIAALDDLVRSSRRERNRFVVVTNYDTLRSDDAQPWLKKQGFELVVYDEAHRIKAPRGRTSLAASRLRQHVGRVVMMSGTPMPHSPMDVFAQFRALDATVFGRSFVSFRNRYAIMGGYKMKQVTGFRNQAEMVERMSGVMFSPPEGSVKLNLPDARHEVIRVDLSPKARKLYEQLSEGLVAAIEEGAITAQNGLVKLLRMQQLCSGEAVVEEMSEDDQVLDDAEMVRRLMEAPSAARFSRIPVCNAKRDALIDILEGTDEPVVVFGQFRRDMDVIAEAAKAVGAPHSEVSGEANTLDAWLTGQTRVLGVQIASGSEGIDLTRARICVYLSTGFNLGHYLQSLARVHRPGQSRAVVYYHIHARSSVDGVVWRVLQKREDLVQGTLAAISRGDFTVPDS